MNSKIHTRMDGFYEPGLYKNLVSYRFMSQNQSGTNKRPRYNNAVMFALKEKLNYSIVKSLIN
jgi:hypothetical protein